MKLMINVEDEGSLVLQDYLKGDQAKIEMIKKEMSSWDDDELLDLNSFSRLLGFANGVNLDHAVVTRGYRILRKIPRLPIPVVDNLVKVFGELQRILAASTKNWMMSRGSEK